MNFCTYQRADGASRPGVWTERGIVDLQAADPSLPATLLEILRLGDAGIALARALAWSPRAVLLDEPFSALDDATRETVREQVRATLAGLDVPVLLVTHDEEDVALFAAPVLRIERGIGLAAARRKENGAVHHDSVQTAP